MLADFALERPRTLLEALALIDEDAVPYHGGTELLLAMKMGLLRPSCLVDLKSVSGLAGVTSDGNGLTIGAGTTHARLAADPLLREQLPLLADVEAGVGNVRVRAQGSVGGNLCFAEPRSDVTTVLAAMDAVVTLESLTGSREVPVADFLLGAYWSDREPGELLTRITVPLVNGRGPVGVYLKLQTSERPTVGVAALRRDGGFHLAIGAVSEKPVLLDVAGPDLVDDDWVAERIEPLVDLAGSATYKNHVTAVYVRRAIAAVRNLAA